jgi:Protein of unknown function (DUF3105)
MASRKEQKEAARQRRLAEERERLERQRRMKRTQRVLGGVVSLLVVAVVVVVIASSGGGSKNGAGTPIKEANTSGVKLPASKTTNLTAAVKAAGCVTIDTPDAIARSDQNRQHVQPGTNIKYATNPPSYGPHYPAPASDGEYTQSNIPATPYLVHALEHGRIEYQYNPSLPQADVKQLEALMQETDGKWGPRQLLLLFPNPTRMPYAVAATAWGHVLGCKTWSPAIFDALRAFRIAYTYQGPELLGTGPE